MVPLSAFASYQRGTTPITVNHQSGRVAATISFNLPPGVALGTAAATIQRTMSDLDVPLTITGGFAGTAAAFASSQSTEPLLILAALAAVYIVLGILYENTFHPLTILSTIPSAGVGATLFLLMLNTPLTIIALIGVILLIGIVKKNAILMIDFALALQRGEGVAPEEAIFQAALLRFRPIMMTTFAATLGALPLAIGIGQGASLRQPLGLTIIGGLLVSQALTLYTTPVLYLWLERLAVRLRGPDHAAPRAGSIAEAD
jgi:multidrug efflux pump